MPLALQPGAICRSAATSRSPTPRACSRGYVHGVVIRTFGHERIETLARAPPCR